MMRAIEEGFPIVEDNRLAPRARLFLFSSHPCSSPRTPRHANVLNSLDEDSQAALWFNRSSVSLPQGPGMGSEVISIQPASSSGPWRQTEPLGAVLFCGGKGQCDPGPPARAGAPVIGMPRGPAHSTRLLVFSQDEFLWT